MEYNNEPPTFIRKFIIDYSKENRIEVTEMLLDKKIRLVDIRRFFKGKYDEKYFPTKVSIRMDLASASKLMKYLKTILDESLQENIEKTFEGEEMQMFETEQEKSIH